MRIKYDVKGTGTRTPDDKPTRRTRRVKLPEPGSFEDRVSGRRRDLAKLIREGVPPVEYLRASDGMLVRNGRHLIAAPQKSGKSLATLAHVVRMAREGASVIVLDRENGSHEYARRLSDIFEAWSLPERERRRVGERLHYVEFPKLQEDDRAQFGEWAKGSGAELVVFDAQRLFLTDLGLAEDDADDYSRFIVAAVEPLTERGIATLILDNTGHAENGRARGSSSKGDLNEVLFVLETAEAFSRERAGRLVLRLEPGRSRFGNEGEWSMRLGGGEFGEWMELPRSGAKLRGSSAPDDRARQLITDYVRDHPGTSQTKAVRETLGQRVGKPKLEEACRALVADGALIRDANGRLHVPSQG